MSATNSKIVKIRTVRIRFLIMTKVIRIVTPKKGGQKGRNPPNLREVKNSAATAKTVVSLANCSRVITPLTAIFKMTNTKSHRSSIAS